ncbi:riboflavin synthase [Saxibacter everestensis]|uniref:Riboflavin synthase n=1 Tax=Saxibacter everestensis TaxID=2909229 RepID=A0ABY8QWM7_9MICO|nr:riboflavin synthase [Brevibacteriaceae bacterium ZFBP1038]
MFTGIIEELGTVAGIDVSPETQSATLRIDSTLVVSDAADGDSIAVNGVCLTVTGFSASQFAVDVMNETLQRSALARLRAGDRVNLERAMPASGRFGGHIVQGHVDGVGTLLTRESTPKWDMVRISLPPELRRYVVGKGSITVDGTSLTVASVDQQTISIGLIPSTLAKTTLGTREIGDQVNLEVDVLAKYVENLISIPNAGSTS